MLGLWSSRASGRSIANSFRNKIEKNVDLVYKIDVGPGDAVTAVTSAVSDIYEGPDTISGHSSGIALLFNTTHRDSVPEFHAEWAGDPNMKGCTAGGILMGNR